MDSRLAFASGLTQSASQSGNPASGCTQKHAETHDGAASGCGNAWQQKAQMSMLRPGDVD